MQKPKPVTYQQVSTIHMVEKGETTHPRVIHDGIVKNWVGFGWVEERGATEEDYNKYPEVKN